jgi:hypothetical protein
MRSYRRVHGLVLALAAAICSSMGCSGRVSNQPQNSMPGTPGSKGSGAAPNGAQIPDGSLDCGSIPAPQTTFQCPSGVNIRGTYVPDNGACVLVYNCPTPGPGSGQDGDAPVNGGGTPMNPGNGPGATGPTYPCGDAGLQCACPADYFPPAPYNDAGQQETLAFSPPPGPVTPYSSTAEFDAIAVGRWRRTAGEAEVKCETIGLEITTSHTFVPLVTASDGSLQAVPLLAQPFTLTFSNGTPQLPGNNAPVFFDAGSGPGTGMQLNITPWLANYVKMP